MSKILKISHSGPSNTILLELEIDGVKNKTSYNFDDGNSKRIIDGKQVIVPLPQEVLDYAEENHLWTDEVKALYAINHPEPTAVELADNFALAEHAESTKQLKGLEIRWIKAMQGDLSETEAPESIAATMIQWRQYTTVEDGKPKIREGKSRPL